MEKWAEASVDSNLMIQSLILLLRVGETGVTVLTVSGDRVTIRRLRRLQGIAHLTDSTRNYYRLPLSF